jgi:hypothetical protein
LIGIFGEQENAEKAVEKVDRAAVCKNQEQLQQPLKGLGRVTG